MLIFKNDTIYENFGHFGRHASNVIDIICFTVQLLRGVKEETLGTTFKKRKPVITVLALVGIRSPSMRKRELGRRIFGSSHIIDLC